MAVAGEEVLHLHRGRGLVEGVHQLVVAALEVGIGRIAAGVGCAVGEEDVEGALGGGRSRHQHLVLQRHRRVQDDAANAFRMVPHDRERQAGAVGDAVEVPLVVAECDAEVGNVSGIVGAGVAGHVHGIGGDSGAAGSERLGNPLGVFLLGEHLVQQIHLYLALFGAGEIGLAEADAALVEDDHFAVGGERPEAIFESELETLEGVAAGASLEVHDRVRLCGTLSVEDGDVESYLVALRIVAVLRHDEVTAAWCAVERGDEPTAGLLEARRVLRGACRSRRRRFHSGIGTGRWGTRCRAAGRQADRRGAGRTGIAGCGNECEHHHEQEAEFHGAEPTGGWELHR